MYELLACLIEICDGACPDPKIQNMIGLYDLQIKFL